MSFYKDSRNIAKFSELSLEEFEKFYQIQVLFNIFITLPWIFRKFY